jgi:hypothetical protein
MLVVRLLERMNITNTRFVPVMLLAAIFIFGSGCATHSSAWEYKTIQRLDYPDLNDDSYRYVYAFPWKQQLSIYEQQGWSVDSVSVSERDLAGGQKMKMAKIVLKRPKQ